ncbi:hypothetical protein JK635_01900 [Neobacillus sp. YIM B02564]|uniref:Phage major capsid protein n=1 Tax=Neobacillus paridis TaxID=2803862 RepID=A0ABS1TI57_9BACI|nr:hypothetical protein [Neobacillus paridis]MBL4950992.1 hypothetical protein [Neobacillus paridis]
MKNELVKLCVDTVKNPSIVQNFSKGLNPSDVIRKEFFELIGTEKPTYKDLRKHKVEVFEIIEEVLDQTVINGVNEDDFFMQFAETRNVALGDSIEFYVPDNSLLVASELAGNHWDISRQKLDVGSTFTVKTKSFGLAVYADFMQFLAGRIDFAELVNKVAKAIKHKIAQEVAASFAAGAGYLPTEFKATGSYSEDKLMDIVGHVEAATGTTPMIVGTRKALAKVTAGANVALFSENMKDQLNQTGRIAMYNGLVLVQLPNVHKANTFEFAYDDNKLLILPSNDNRPVKLVFEGDSLVKEVSDGTQNMDMSLEYKFMTKFGVQVIFNTLYGEYTLS